MTADHPSAAEAFSLLSNPIRIEILTVLMEEDGASFETPAIPFSDIYDRVDIEDSGQLNYHLSKLTGHFVEKADGGYRFRHAGRKIVWAIRAGAVTGEAERTFPAPGTCYECGAAELEAATANNWLLISCSACDTPHTSNPFPSGGLAERSAETVLSAFDRIVRARLSLASERVCIECTGEMSVRVSEATPERWDLDAVLVYQCPHCGYWLTVPFGLVLIGTPEAKQFYRDRGIDPNDRPYWDLSVCVNDAHTTVLSQEPWRIQVETTVGGDTLTATMDGVGELISCSSGA